MNHPTPFTTAPGPTGAEMPSGPPAEAYARFRPGVPDQVSWLLADTMTGVPAVTLLDLGGGTGQVAAAMLPALPRIRHVDLVDPSRAMLREAVLTLHPLLGDRTLACHETQAEGFASHHCGYQADLITCARAFHRMDRAAVLAMAHRVAAPHTALALLDDGHLLAHDADWTAALRDLIHSTLGSGHRPGTYDRDYKDQLAASAFSLVSRHLFRFPRSWTPQQVIGYLRTSSSTLPELFGEQHADFEAEATQLLESYATGGQLTEQVDFAVLLAHRSGGTR